MPGWPTTTGAWNGFDPICLSSLGTLGNAWRLSKNISVFETGSFYIDKASLELPILQHQPVGWDDR